MTKTHAELLTCPFCGKNPLSEPYNEEGFEEDIVYFIGCRDISCDFEPWITEPNKEQALKKWNNRFNKEAEFLEELKLYLEKEMKFKALFVHNIDSQKAAVLYQKILNKIEQFQVEQKQVSDE